jgi:predicted nucleotidyltransferase
MEKRTPGLARLEAEKARRVKAAAAACLENARIWCYMNRMDKNLIIATLLENRAELERQGVLHAALFGSMARGDATAESDIDIMIDLDPNLRLSVFEYVGLKDYIGSLFPISVDVVNRELLKTPIKPTVIAQAIHAF